MKNSLLLFFCAFAFKVTAQFGSSVYKNLNINNINALIMNRGDMFWDTQIGSPRYIVSKDTVTEFDNLADYPIFASALWLGAIDTNGQLHVAAQTYRQNGNDFWPGPLDTLTGSIDSIISNNYDKIWKINRFDIEEFKYNYNNGSVQNGTYSTATDIVNWPAQGTGAYSRNLAPFFDNNNNGIYDPIIGGDYPIIKGDQMLFWIFNDNLKTHTETNGEAIKVEVHASAYAYFCDSLPDSMKSVNYTTFYNYKIFNRSHQNYDSVFVGSWTDFEAYEVYPNPIASIPRQNSIISRSCCKEEITVLPYLTPPPAMSQIFLKGPIAKLNDGLDNDNDSIFDEVNETHLLNNFICYNNTNSNTGNPTNPLHYYNYLSSRWKDGTPLTYGNSGTQNTNFFNGDFFIDDSIHIWTKEHYNDSRAVASMGPLYLNTYQPIEFEYAFIYNRDYNNIDYNEYYSKSSILNDYKQIRKCYDENNFPSCLKMNVGILEQTNELQINIYPNPVTNQLNVQCLNFDERSKLKNIEMYNVLGKQVLNQTLKTQNTTLNIQHLTKGIYFVKISGKMNSKTLKVIIQ